MKATSGFFVASGLLFIGASCWMIPSLGWRFFAFGFFLIIFGGLMGRIFDA